MKTQNPIWPRQEHGRPSLLALLVGCFVALTSSGATWNSNPPHGWTDWSANTGLRWSWYAAVEGPVTYAVYFGTNPVPGPAELLGSTTNRTWPLPLLVPATTYYWRIVSDHAELGSSPVWQFTTRGLHHFEWDVPAATQQVGRAFDVTVRAVDEFRQTVSNYSASVRLAGFTNWVPILLWDNFEDGDALGWETCPEGWAVVATNVPGVSGQFCLSVLRRTSPCDDGLLYWLKTNRTLPHRMTFRVRTSATNVTSAIFNVEPDEGLVFSMRRDGTMGIGAPWIDWSPRLPCEPYRWYKITVALERQLVEDGYWDDGVWVPEHYTLLWMDWYVDDQLVAAHFGGKRFLFPVPEYVRLENDADLPVWFDDIEVSAAPVPMPIRIQPLGLVRLSNGIWTGQVLVEEPAQGLYLQADDGQQHLGTSSPFTVLVGLPFAITRVARTNDQLRLGWEGGTGLYQLQQRTDLLGGAWHDIGGPTTNITFATNITANAVLYRVQGLPNP